MDLCGHKQEGSAERMEPLLHTIPGAQARVPVGRSTLYELIKSGQIRAVKIGRRTYIADDELKRYVASLDHGAGTDPAAFDELVAICSALGITPSVLLARAESSVSADELRDWLESQPSERPKPPA